jgi:AMP-polyphosphate phosphotransferase
MNKLIFESGGSLAGAEYEKKLDQLQAQLTLIQQAYLVEKKAALVVLEGVDAAGKGGLIRRIAWAMDPRGLLVHPIGPPEPMEKEEHYMQRFWRRLPRKGQIALFDRSWYGRVLVERVEGFAAKEDWKRAYDEINEMEHSLAKNGVRVMKLLLHVSKEEQARRLLDRIDNPSKRWKLSYEDFRNRNRWDEYDKAMKEMLRRTDTSVAPWKVIACDQKKQARIWALEWLVKELKRGVQLSPPPLPQKLKSLADALRREIKEPRKGSKRML